MKEFLVCPDEMAAYESLVCSGMAPDDVHDAATFAEMILDGRLLAWWHVVDGEKVGWCALHPWHDKYAPNAWHLYGVWVREDFRRKGLAESMWRERMARVPKGTPITVSVQPGKEGSLALVRKLGFEWVLWNEPWDEYVFWNK